MSPDPAFRRLDGSDTTLRLEHASDVETLRVHDDTALAYAKLDTVTPLTLFPERCTDRTGSPALEGHRDGTRFARRFVTERVGVPLPVLPSQQALPIGCLAADAVEEGR